jgi:TATA-box binding protein (TBP) (component of TFIID and TFIIIB)
MNLTTIPIEINEWNSYKYIDYIGISGKEVTELGDGISISTMCASAKLSIKLNIVNIENFLCLNSNDVLSVKSNNKRIRSLITIPNKPKRLTKYMAKMNKDISGNHFYNQITIVMRITNGISNDLDKEPKINMKLFKNGSIQMSGCKTVEGINIALNKLLIRLKEVKAKIEDGVITEKPFIEGNENINIYSFKIDMINCNYKLNIQIDRTKLYNLLVQQKIRCVYEPCIRACVIVKYMPTVSTKGISIFIFQRGNIIITGAKSRSQVISTYEYINNIITNHKENIIQRDEKEEEELIFKLYSEIIDDARLGLLEV